MTLFVCVDMDVFVARVVLPAQVFGDDHDKQYIYKEPAVTTLAEIVLRLQKLYSKKFGTGTPVNIIHESGKVHVYLHVRTHVCVHVHLNICIYMYLHVTVPKAHSVIKPRVTCISVCLYLHIQISLRSKL